jgi:hypothetical protein
LHGVLSIGNGQKQVIHFAVVCGNQLANVLALLLKVLHACV